ncbi:steroidogenic acute regulatory protein-like isoform X3 [Phymastichus coffea]|uniref:steroidogenic acute regulatory protein-like isoform X3 n=1 Tax=Phymastichus coffea TaxID=108790 RepID=UPI00273C01BC|nr:steroidogenic acute regulatory protein-like isoform X3 [Phymastichus coffea]
MMTECDRQMRIAADDRQIRTAAESLLNASINSGRSSYAQNLRSPDYVNEAFVAGLRYNGRMSNVRRFFCLFVTFDFLFTILMWLICIMISGKSVQTSFVDQIVHYNVKTSLFDIVMTAACRFTILLLFYALLHINHWFVVAASTTLTCAFLLTKVFLYDWSKPSQPVFEVLLVLTSFVLVWSEVWFLDIKVIPQESQARDWFLGFPDTERAPLLSPSSVVPAFMPVENAGSFYTPMDSPDHSDDEGQSHRRRIDSHPSFLSTTIDLKLPLEKVEECKREAPLLLKKCYDLIVSQDWKVEQVTEDGDVVSWMVLPKPDGKIFKITVGHSRRVGLEARKVIVRQHRVEHLVEPADRGVQEDLRYR